MTVAAAPPVANPERSYRGFVVVSVMLRCRQKVRTPTLLGAYLAILSA
ncbi:MAG: hypothetical protein H6972_10865 [Gammaproteobacteria bacterium]|nr:hypothetical protein [Gammaproteobacteria bacterium]